MDGNQTHVEVGIQFSVLGPFAQKHFHDAKLLIGPCQLHAEKKRHNQSDNTHYNTCYQELL